MDDESYAFQDLMQRLHDGCPEAARILHDRYSRHIHTVVRQRLNLRMRTLYDSDDFLQSVWRSFFLQPNQPRFSSPEEMIRFLARIAFNKVVETYRKRMQTQRYSLKHEQPFGTRDDGGMIEPLSHDPTPSQQVSHQEELEQLLHSQPEKHRQILELFCQGLTYKAIARKLGIHESTVNRLIQRIRASRQS